MDNVLLNKIAIIERSLKRIKEEYRGFEKELETNFCKQDSIILNLQRAYSATIEIGARLIRMHRLGIPQMTKDIFVILEKDKIIPKKLSSKLQNMIGFRNVAAHGYKNLNIAILRSILEKDIKYFSEFTKYLFEKFSNSL